MRPYYQSSIECGRDTSWRRVLLLALAALAFSGAAEAQNYVEDARFRQPSPEIDFLSSTVSLDGDTAVLSGTEQLMNPSRRPGAVFVYRKTSGQWALEQRLVDPATQHNDDFGRALRLDGDTLVVGASAGCISGRGGFSIYQRSGATWVLQRSYVANGTQDQCLGRSVGLSGDTAAVGAPNGVSASVQVVRRVNGAWGNVVRLLAPTTYPRFSFGSGVAISGDTMCVMSRSNAGTALIDVFTRDGAGTWSLQEGIVPPASTAGFLDMSCAVDGNTLIAGIRSHSTPKGQFVGISHVYTRNNGAWTLQQTLTPPGAGSYFGHSVSVRGDEAVVSQSAQQVAHVYRRTGTNWALAQSIAKVTTSGVPGSVGVSLAASGLLVGQGGHSHGVYTLSAAPSAPGAPTGFTATATGNAISMAWGAPVSGSPATSYSLLARTTAGAAPIVTVPLGNVTSFAANGPDGTFILSVRASNAQGDGPESNPATVTLPGGAATLPSPPTGFGVTVNGSTASFSWTAPVSGGAPTGYLLVAGSTPGFAAPIASVPIPAGQLGLTVPGVPVGTYYVRVLSTNAAGTSGPSNEVQLTVAGALPPGAPVLNAPSVSGSMVSLTWAAGSGGSPTGYTLIAAATPGGAPIASVPLSGTSVSFNGVPSGTYYLRMTASNAAGTSTASNEITLVVP